MSHLNDGDTVKVDDVAPGEGEFWIIETDETTSGCNASWLVQRRFPKSKKRRIRKKWEKRISNWKRRAVEEIGSFIWLNQEDGKWNESMYLTTVLSNSWM